MRSVTMTPNSKRGLFGPYAQRSEAGSLASRFLFSEMAYLAIRVPSGRMENRDCCHPATFGGSEIAGSDCAHSKRWVINYAGHMGNTFRLLLGGVQRCLK